MKLNQVTAEAINATLRRVGIALRLEYVTPGDAQRQLEQNPELLRTHGLSQKMSGDASDETVDAAKGRPFVATLIDRIQNDKWNFYFGVLSRCANGAVVDGVTRLIAISRAGKPVWVLTYNDADPKDFFMYDDTTSARSEKDVFGNLGLPSEMAGVLGVMVPKAAGSVDEDGGYKRVIRDKWFSFFKKYEREFIEAFSFVKKERGESAVPRKNLTAYMYFRFVARPGAKNITQARHLLTVYKTKRSTNKVEDQLRDLNTFFQTNKQVLHERNHCLPLFLRVLKAALAGEVVRYDLRILPGPGDTKVYDVTYGKQKAAAVGR